MKKSLLLILTVVAILLFATSCNTLRIRMGERSYFYLLPLTAVPEPVDSYQLIAGSFPGYENVAIEAWFTSDESSLNLVMFAPTGQTMGKVFYDGQKLSFESSFLPEYRIIGMFIIADLQLCFASTEAISLEFSDSDLILMETYSEDVLRRRVVLENDEVIYNIEYEEGGIHVVNRLRDYGYSIEFLQ